MTAIRASTTATPLAFAAGLARAALFSNSLASSTGLKSKKLRTAIVIPDLAASGRELTRDVRGPVF